MQGRSNGKFPDLVEAASPPVPSRNADFCFVHDEIVVFQNVARVFLGTVIESAIGGPVSWPKFVTDATPHRTISTIEEKEHFLKAKTISKRDLRR